MLFARNYSGTVYKTSIVHSSTLILMTKVLL